MRLSTTRQNDSSARSGEAPSRSLEGGDQGKPSNRLLLGRLPTRRDPQRQINLSGRFGPGFSLKSGGEQDSLAVHERAVEHPQSLGRLGRREPDGGRAIRLGLVEALQDRQDQRPLDVDVDAPPRLLGRWRLAPAGSRNRLAGHDLGRDLGEDARPVHLQVQGPGDGQDRVADLLGRQPPHVEPPEPVVGRVDRHRGLGLGFDDI